MKKHKILIVDDETPLAEMICLNFPEEKFAARACNTGKDALLEIEREPPDLMILDVMMGDMDGWEALSKLRKNPKTSGIPVIMCTARDGPQDVEKSFKCGAQSYIIKPIDFSKLMMKVAAILDVEELLKD